MRLTLAVVLVAVVASAQEQPPSERFFQAIRADDLAALGGLVHTLGPGVKDSLGQTPLMVASAFGSSGAMRLLIAGGADVRAASTSGVTALHWSVRDPAKVRLLLDGGADVHARSGLGRTPLLVASSTSGTAEVVRLLLDRGADANVADTAGVTPLIAAASVDDTEVALALLARGAAVNGKANVGGAATALLGAAYNGNVELTRALLGRGADVNVVSADRNGVVKNGPVQFGNVTPLHMATASGSVDVVRLLLDAGAHVDPPDVRGMTPLMWSVATDRPEPRLIRLLLDKGADAARRSAAGESTLEWARKFNNPAVLAGLGLPAADGTWSRQAPPEASDRYLAPRAAVQRSMPLLRRASANMLTAGGCVACHAQPVTAIAAELASERGWGIERAADDVSLVVASTSAAAQGLLQAREGGGLPDTQIYNAMMLAAQRHPRPSAATDALVYYLAAKQRPEGNWHGVGATRAPIQDGDFSRTAMSIRALAVFGSPALKAELDGRIERAAAWLAAQVPLTTEDRVMQLLGLAWARAKADVREAGTRALVAAQRPDGGWAQTPYLESDAYATGQAIYALREMGVPASGSALQSGVAFLLRTQQADGSWYVKSRAMKIQPYFESGFPHGHDQWISQTATAWAVMALCRAAPEETLAAVMR